MNISFNEVQTMCNAVKRRFPYSSPWELRYIKGMALQKAFEQETNLSVKTDICAELKKVQREYSEKKIFNRSILDESSKHLNQPFMYYKALIDGLDFFKTCWCGAAAKLMYMVARLNGVAEGDVERGFLVVDNELTRMCKTVFGDAYMPSILDHTVNIVNTGTSIVEADATLNKVYKEGEMHKVLEREYKEALKLPKDADISLCPEKAYPKKYNDMPHLDKESIDKLAEQYPELLI